MGYYYDSDSDDYNGWTNDGNNIQHNGWSSPPEEECYCGAHLCVSIFIDGSYRHGTGRGGWGMSTNKYIIPDRSGRTPNGFTNSNATEVFAAYQATRAAASLPWGAHCTIFTDSMFLLHRVFPEHNSHMRTDAYSSAYLQRMDAVRAQCERNGVTLSYDKVQSSNGYHQDAHRRAWNAAR